MSIYNIEDSALRLRFSKQSDSSFWVYVSYYDDFVCPLCSNVQIPKNWLLPHPLKDQNGVHFEVRNWNDVQPQLLTVFKIHFILEGLSSLLDKSSIHRTHEQMLSEWEIVLLWLGCSLYSFYWHTYYSKPLCLTRFIWITRLNLRWVWWFDRNCTCFNWIIPRCMCRLVHSPDI